MAKSYSLAFISLFLLLFNSCQSIEQISIDYLQPADLSFPPQLRKVAVVNNTSDAPDNKLITEVQKTKENVPAQPMPTVIPRLLPNHWLKK